MLKFSFEETVEFLSEKLNKAPPKEDIEGGEIELVIDKLHVVIAKGRLEGSLHMQIILGLMLHPVREEKLKELATSNFLGIDTGGCTLAFDEAGVALSLHAHTTCPVTPQENWEWLHRVVCVAREWMKVLTEWDEFVVYEGK